MRLKANQATNKVLRLNEKNAFLEKMMARLAEIRDMDQDKQEKAIVSIEHEIKNSLNNSGWDEFTRLFEAIDPVFLKKLDQLPQKLTEREKRLLALSKLGLSIRETAQVLNIESSSVKMARYRLKKKLDIEDHLDLDDFINGLSN